MNRPVRTGVPVRVTSDTSMTPREVDTSTLLPAFVASISYLRTPPPESTTISTQSPLTRANLPRAGVIRAFGSFPLLRLDDALGGNGAEARRMNATLHYVCGKCLARLQRDESTGAWSHAGIPNCGRDPVPMFKPLPREPRRADTGHRVVPDPGKRAV